MTAALDKELERIAMSPALASTLARAAEYASKQAHVEVTLEHLLLALTEDTDAEIVLATSNVRVSQLKIDVAEQLGRIEERLPLNETATSKISSEVRRILEASAQAARGRRNEINGAIVLAAIVGDGNSVAANLLRVQGLTFEAAIKALQSSLSPTQPATAPPPAQPAAAPPPSQPAAPQPPPAPEPQPAAPPHQQRQTTQPPPGASTAEDLLARARTNVKSRSATGTPAQHKRASETTAPAPAPAPAPPQPEQSAPAPELDQAPQTAPAPPRTEAPAEGSWAPPKPNQPPPQPQQPRPLRPPPPPSSDVTNAPPQKPASPELPVGQPTARPGSPANNPLGGVPPGTDNRGASSFGTASGPLPTGSSTPSAQPPSGARLPSRPGAPPPRDGTQQPAAPQPSAPWPDQAKRRQPGANPTQGGPPRQQGRPPSPAPRARQQQQQRSQTTRTQRPVVEAGQLVENIPRTMQVDIPTTAEISIAGADVKNLADNLQGAAPAHRHNLAITKAMSVRLRAPNGGFFIETASPETQWIDNNLGIEGDDHATWRWTVTPKERGNKRLQVIVSARTIGADGLAAETALPEQVIEVKVRANHAKNAKRLGTWTLAAVAGGLLARFGEQAWETGRQFILSIMAG